MHYECLDEYTGKLRLSEHWQIYHLPDKTRIFGFGSLKARGWDKGKRKTNNIRHYLLFKYCFRLFILFFKKKNAIQI